MHIPNRENYVIIKPIDKGWSKDLKYYLETKTGEKRLIRFSPFSFYEKKKDEFDALKSITSLNVPMSRPLEFGTTPDNTYVYMVLSWVEGEDLEIVLPNLEKSEQYRLGREAGTILRQVHALQVIDRMIPNSTGHEKKMRQIKAYESSDHRFENDGPALNMVEKNIDKIWTRKPVLCHGDFHPGNLIYMKDGHLGVIDFNRLTVTDPYESFYKLQSFARNISVLYAIGQIHAYFDDSIPDDFFEAMAVYVAHASLYSIRWAEAFGEADIRFMRKLCRQAFDDYDDFTRMIPKWYVNPEDIEEILNL